MCSVTQELKNKVWLKGQSVQDYDDSAIRKDACGAWIKYEDYGNRQSIYGWEIDHVFPQAVLRNKQVLEEDIDNLDNLRPLNWINNDSKGTDYPTYEAKVCADGDLNVRKVNVFTVNEDVQNLLNGLYGKYLK